MPAAMPSGRLVLGSATLIRLHQPRRLAAAEDDREHLQRVGVGVLRGRDLVPGDHDAELRRLGRGEAAGLGLHGLGGGIGRPGRGLALGHLAEPLLGRGLDVLGGDVTDHHQQRVVGDVVRVVELLQIGRRGLIEIADRAAGGPRVRMGRERGVEELQHRDRQRVVLLLADLLLHDLALGLDHVLAEQQVPHALGLERTAKSKYWRPAAAGVVGGTSSVVWALT